MISCSITPRLLRAFDIPFETALDFALPSAKSAPVFTVSETAWAVGPVGACEEAFSWELKSGAKWLQVTKTASDYYLSFPGYVDVLVSRDAKRVLFHRGPGITWPTIEHLLVDHVIPLVLSLSGESVLHCSAVASRVGALVFTGKTGQGKSTLAAALALRGCPLLSDDSLLLRPAGREIMAVPSYPSLRLWPEDTRHFEQLGAEISDVAQYTSKKRLRVDASHGSFAEKPVKTTALYILANAVAVPDGPLPQSCPDADGDTPIAVRKLSAREVFMELVQNSIQMDRVERVSLKSQSEKLAVLANAIPAFRLSYPHDHALLPKVVDAVVEHAASLESTRFPK
jgi:hypothetical protein